MTRDTIAETAALKALLCEAPDHQLLAEMLGFVADRLRALDVDQLCGAGAHECSDERVNQRNGVTGRYGPPVCSGSDLSVYAHNDVAIDVAWRCEDAARNLDRPGAAAALV